jgi:hypothetical protein
MLSSLFRDICDPNVVNKNLFPKKTSAQQFADQSRIYKHKKVYESAPTTVDIKSTTDTTCTTRIGYLGKPTQVIASLTKLSESNQPIVPVNTQIQFSGSNSYTFVMLGLTPNSYYRVIWSTVYIGPGAGDTSNLNPIDPMYRPRTYTGQLVRHFYTHGPPENPVMDVFGRLQFDPAVTNPREQVTYELRLVFRDYPTIVITKSDISDSPVRFTDIPSGTYTGVMRSIYSGGEEYDSVEFEVISNSNIPVLIPGILTTENLALYYDVANPAGYNSATARPIKDLSGNGRDGTAVGVTVSDGVVSVNVTPTVTQFINTNYNPVEFATHTTANPVLYTFEMWFYDDSFGTVGGGTNTTLIGNLFNSSNTFFTIMHISTTGNVLVAERSGTTSVQTSSLPLTPGVWHHLVKTASATTQAIYIDGVLQPDPEPIAGRSTGSLVTGTNSLRIGGGWVQRGQTCRIGPVRIYMNKALNFYEINSNYNFERARFNI